MSGENRDPRVDPEIGRTLEGVRKSRGLTLWQVEQETRIRSRYLRDLERENFDVLPAVYVLGSLKTYADFLGLDGAALSRQLKASLVEPAEPDDVPEQFAALGGARDEDDEYEAAPVPAVGFDQLFLGMGVILISILAVMTIVAAVAQGDEPPVSQIDQPSTPEAPSEIALAGNVQDGDVVKGAGDDDPVKDENREDQPKDKPEAPKDGEESKDEGEKDDQAASQSVSLFGDANFVPVSPPSPTSAAPASAGSVPASPASAGPTSASSTAASPAPTSAASASPEPTTAEPGESPASAAPASTGAPPVPAEDSPDVASPAPAAPGGGGSPRVGGGEGGQTAPAGETGSDLISAEVDRKVDEAFEEAGIVR